MCLRPSAFNPSQDAVEDHATAGDVDAFEETDDAEPVVEYLNHLESSTDQNSQTNPNFETEGGMTPLIFACISNMPAMIRRLLQMPEIAINYKNKFECSAVIASCEANRIDSVKSLMEQPALNRQDLNSGFCLACRQGHVQMVEFLLECPDVDSTYLYKTPDDEELSGLALACAHGRFSVVQTLLKHIKNHNIDEELILGGLVMACRMGHHDIAALLLDEGNPTTDHLNHGFHEACTAGHASIVDLLLQNPQVDVNFGVPLNDDDIEEMEMFPNGVTSFFLACQENQTAVVTRLLTHPKLDPMQLSWALCATNDTGIIDLLLRHPSIDLTIGVGGLPPLTIACVDRNVSKIKRLLQAPTIDVNFKHENGTTAFMVACANGFDDVAKLLMGHHGLKMTTPNQHGASALAIACEAGHVEVVSLLLQCDPFKNQFEIGQALGVSCANGHDEIVQLLLSTSLINHEHLHLGLFLACQQGYPKIVESILHSPKHNVKINETIDVPDLGRMTSLFVAVANGNEEVAAILLRHPGINVNRVRGTEGVPLVQASMAGFAAIVKMLIQQPGIDISCENSDGETALMAAQFEKHKDIEAILLRHIAPQFKSPPQKRRRKNSTNSSDDTEGISSESK